MKLVAVRRLGGDERWLVGRRGNCHVCGVAAERAEETQRAGAGFTRART